MSNQLPMYRGKYHTKSDRFKDWDYSKPGFYFITVCTQKRIPWFGEVQNEHMVISPPGRIVTDGITKIESLHQNVQVASQVVMPNHIHMIIEITTDSVETPHWGVSTKKRFWRSGILGVMINQFKSYCTKRIRLLGYVDFAWQAGYYDHIIRNKKSLENIYKYIIGNPAKWTDDEYFVNI